MLKKRLYFLLPDKDEVRRSLDELRGALGATDYRLHVVGVVDGEPAELPELGGYRRTMTEMQRERYLTLGSTVVFVAALIALVAALLYGAWALSVLFAALVFAMQLSGYLFSDRPGSAELDRFRDSFDEGNLLLMVDVPRQRVGDVERVMHNNHPAAASGGQGWYIDALGH